MPVNRATARYSIVLPTLGSLNERDLLAPAPSEREAQTEALAELSRARGRDYTRLSMKSVAADSPLKARQAVEQIGVFFQREGGFDTQPYRADKVPDETRAYLIYSSIPEQRALIVGAICFGWYQWKSSPASYCLEWVWIHPYERRKGLLSAKWPYFRARFKDFAVSKPRTRAMQRFLEKIEPELYAPLPTPTIKAAENADDPFSPVGGST